MKGRVEQALIALSFALVLSAFALYSFRLAWSSTAIVESVPCRLEGPIECGEEVRVSIALANRSAGDVKLVGSGDFCGPRGCISILGLPKLIRRRSQASVQAQVKAPSRPGPFELKTAIFTDWRDQQQVEVEVSGEAVGSPGR
ncbi:hypothetical protein SAMN05444166_4985 [Singulisphaera sp. GP187]|uniref:hypothetical protein n=1 Tax=Singulisphaera sp. GP187 TaxID=1882752 RepID=UPI00092B4506|nr:hypothetical protein [Singulisphaera sp. GP187]SIO46741.1 hypothetical protein SAMN05444166_4985 [Singulisphaera sp. GP187]